MHNNNCFYLYLQKQSNFMRKLFIVVMCFGGILSARAQAVNEVKVNILNAIAMASVEVGYEHFIDRDQSVGVDLMLNDRFSYYPESKSKGKKFKTNSVAVNYNFYFGGNNNENGSGYSISPFLKYRFGEFEEDKRNELEGIYTHTTDMNSFILGVGVGYKWVRNDSFAVQPFVNIARNFSEDVNDRFMAIEINAGVTLGYRF